MPLKTTLSHAALTAEPETSAAAQVAAEAF
jgi:hypothetical protein